MVDVLSLGEILVDWVCTTQGAELDRAQVFTKAAGGAPANVAVGLSRQGVPTGFIGRVSTDAFGVWLKNTLRQEGVDLACTVDDPKAHTRMAYVVTTITGDRKLAEFSHISCADAQLSASDLKPKIFEEASILHMGSISLISNPAAEATKAAIELAKKNNMLISYDPNVRISLWPSAQICRQTILDTLHLADVVKINIDELEFLTGSKDFSKAIALREEHNIPLLIVTLDANGAFFTTAKGSKTVPGFQIQLVEATGAGDGFISGVLSGLLKHVKGHKEKRAILLELTQDIIANIIRKANALGALTCTRAGAIPALPNTEEVDTFLEQMTAQTSS